MQVVAHLAVAQALLRQADVTGVVFDEQDLDRSPRASSIHAFASRTGWNYNVNQNVVPRPGSDSTHMRPPWRSTIFLQIARPMPVPGYSARVCRRWNSTQIRSRYCDSMPIPLSCTPKTQSWLSRRAETCTLGDSPRRWNFSPLAIRFWKSCRSWVASPRTVGSSSRVTVPLLSCMAV